MVEVFEASLRVCKGLVAFVVGHGKQDNYKWSATPALLIADLHRKGICLRSPKWYYRHGIPGSGGPDDMRKDVELIVCATAEQRRLPWSDNKAMGAPWKYKPGGAATHRRKDGKRRVSYSNNHKKKQTGDIQSVRPYRHITDAVASDVIDCGAVGGGNIGSNIAHENEAPFPEKLPLFFIKSFCPPKGWVYDPFGGSGTTAAAAIKAGRKFVCSDIRESQIELMKRRVIQAHSKKGWGLHE